MKRGSELIWISKQKLKHLLRQRGWDIRQVTPLNGIDVMLWSLLAQQRVNCVIDVGSHVGDYAMLLRTLGYRGRIASFKPTREAFSDLLSKHVLIRIGTSTPWLWADQRAPLISTSTVPLTSRLSETAPPSDKRSSKPR